MSIIPNHVVDSEVLHRRIHPTFVKPDGSVSSQAFRDDDMSVDRAEYRSVEDTMANYEGYGLAAVSAAQARALQQEVMADPELLNPAHALVSGMKSKSIAKGIARVATWVTQFQSDEETG